MPHFIADCSANIRSILAPDRLVEAIHDTADASGLFEPGDIKVRCHFCDEFTVGGTTDDFVHIIAYLLSGRSATAKLHLAKSIIARLMPLLPTVNTLSIDIRDIEREGYANRHSMGVGN